MELFKEAPLMECSPGETLIEEGKPLEKLLILKEGEVAVVKGGTQICKIAKSGSTFGEMSVLLGVKPTASVVASKPSTLLVVEDAAGFLSGHIEATLEIARLLAHRVRWLTHTYAEELDDGDSALWRYR